MHSLVFSYHLMNKSTKQANPVGKRVLTDKEGNSVNDYIPGFIANAPWYTSSTPLETDSNIRKRKTDEEAINEISDTNRLKHQRIHPEKEIVPNNAPKKGLGINDSFKKIVSDHQPNLDKKQREKLKRKVREWKKKGKCENCGGNHKKIECLEQINNSTIYVRDDNLQNYDETRDNWHGYDNEKDYSKVVDELKKKEIAAVENYKKSHQSTLPTEEGKEDITIQAILDNSKFKAQGDYVGRSLDEKPRYLEVIKTGEELRYNPKSRVYKDLKEGYLNERGQFIPHLTGEAAEFEKLKKFTRSIQATQKVKAEEDQSGKTCVTDTKFSTEFNPTEAAAKLKEKEASDALIREQKRKELFSKYG